MRRNETKGASFQNLYLVSANWIAAKKCHQWKWKTEQIRNKTDLITIITLTIKTTWDTWKLWDLYAVKMDRWQNSIGHGKRPYYCGGILESSDD